MTPEPTTASGEKMMWRKQWMDAAMRLMRDKNDRAIAETQFHVLMDQIDIAAMALEKIGSSDLVDQLKWADAENKKGKRDIPVTSNDFAPAVANDAIDQMKSPKFSI